MEKKLTAQGPRDRKSYTITLPIEWVKSFGLERTRTVEMNMIGAKVIINAKKETPTRTVLDAAMLGTELRRVLPLLYRLGVTEIGLKNTNPSIAALVHGIIEQRLIGFEIVEQGKDHILIKEISTAPSEEFRIVLRRTFLMLLNLSETFYENLRTGKKEMDDMLNLDKGINKFTNFCERTLIREGHSEYTKVPFYYALCTSIEQIGDDYKWFYTDLVKYKIKASPKLLEYIGLINNLLRKSYSFIYHFDLAETRKLSAEVLELRRKIKDDVKDSIPAYYCLAILRKISSMINLVFYLNYQFS